MCTEVTLHRLRKYNKLFFVCVNRCTDRNFSNNFFQDECKQKYNNELSVGKVVDISGGKLPCKTVYLTVLPTYTESSTAEQVGTN